MKKLSLLIILLFTAAISHAQTATIDSTDIKFKKVLDDGKMVFTMPPGFVATPIVKKPANAL